ncbi:MAG: HAD family hydrolase [Egibacteraceae bacterium]
MTVRMRAAGNLDPDRRPPPPDAPVVFDCDGILVDTETCWTRAYNRLFTAHNRIFTMADKLALIGRHLDALSPVLAHLLDRPAGGQRLAARACELALEELAEGAAPMPGAVDLVQELAGRRPLAVASSSPGALIRHLLEQAGIADAFDVILGGGDVDRGKPAPDIYLRACEQLGTQPVNAVAIEDSPPGVAAARAAGMHVIGIPSWPGMRLDAHTIGQSLTDPHIRTALGLR